MRRNSVYIAFILGGALLGERVRPPCLPVQQHHIRVMRRDRRFRLTRGAHGYLPCSQCQVRTRQMQGKSSVVSGAQVVNKGFDLLWESNNKGVRRTPCPHWFTLTAQRLSSADSPGVRVQKLYKHLEGSVIGGEKAEEE
jgi:hypothetical protein